MKEKNIINKHNLFHLFICTSLKMEIYIITWIHEIDWNLLINTKFLKSTSPVQLEMPFLFQDTQGVSG